MAAMQQALLMASGIVTDPYYSLVRSLLSFDELNGANPPADAIAGVTWLNTSSGQAMALTQTRFGAGSSLRTFTTGGYRADINYTIGTNALTAEMWMYFTSYYMAIPDQNRFWDISGGGGGHSLYVDGTTGLLGYVDGSFTQIPTVGIPGLNVWRHIAFQADGVTARVFLDGTQVLATASTLGIPQTTSVSLYSPGRCARGNGDYYSGYMDEVRLTLGLARYTAAGFAVPTAPYPRS